MIVFNGYGLWTLLCMLFRFSCLSDSFPSGDCDRSFAGTHYFLPHSLCYNAIPEDATTTPTGE